MLPLRLPPWIPRSRSLIRGPGHLRVIALAAANQARVRPHSRRVAASRRVCARPPVAAPRGYPCARAPIWRRVDFVLALLRERRFRHVFALQRQCLEFVCSIGISRGVISCLHTALYFAKGATLRAWQLRLSQPRQQVRRRRFLRPGQVRRLRPATSPLVRACQHLGARLPRSRPWQPPGEGMGHHGTQVRFLRAGISNDDGSRDKLEKNGNVCRDG